MSLEHFRRTFLIQQNNMHLDHALSCVYVFDSSHRVFRQLLLLLQSQFDWYVVVGTRRLNGNAKSKNVCAQNKLIYAPQIARAVHSYALKEKLSV